MKNNYQWLSDMLGKPWRAYATGENVEGVEAWDCWGVVVHAFYQLHGVALDRHLDIPTKSPRSFVRVVAQEITSGHWRQISHQKHGCVVLLATATRFHHIGIWLDINGGRLLHSTEGVGVALDSSAHLSNYNLVEYWEYVG
ncbi:NlpC/P60 family protein [Neptunomonas japonica]|uniref:Phage related protein n=1 Tax=Neptunomonas japonica JAMM 1380 TaxID=1441457 RepID=A0A7R6PN03_9GAMM|nr:NlpC/P60 family protein [Neptunomonas japonica]BBB29382.1 phage related protein [Neptunomonas japonica JAMM 1380]